MADFNIYFPKLVKNEGDKYEVVERDSGGCTKYGVTLPDLYEYYHSHNYTCDDIKNLDYSTASKIIKKLYWDFFKADSLTNQSMAELIVDEGFLTGKERIAIYIQVILHISVDGIIGDKSLYEINNSGGDFFNLLFQRIKKRFDSIVSLHPPQEKFYNGWINRLNTHIYIN